MLHHRLGVRRWAPADPTDGSRRAPPRRRATARRRQPPRCRSTPGRGPQRSAPRRQQQPHRGGRRVERVDLPVGDVEQHGLAADESRLDVRLAAARRSSRPPSHALRELRRRSVQIVAQREHPAGDGLDPLRHLEERRPMQRRRGRSTGRPGPSARSTATPARGSRHRSPASPTTTKARIAVGPPSGPIDDAGTSRCSPAEPISVASRVSRSGGERPVEGQRARSVGRPVDCHRVEGGQRPALLPHGLHGQGVEVELLVVGRHRRVDRVRNEHQRTVRTGQRHTIEGERAGRRGRHVASEVRRDQRRQERPEHLIG